MAHYPLRDQYLRGVDEGGELVDLLPGEEVVEEDRGDAGAADARGPDELHAPVLLDATVVGGNLDGEARGRVVARPARRKVVIKVRKVRD